MSQLETLKQRSEEITSQMTALVETEGLEERGLSDDESALFDNYKSELESVQSRIDLLNDIQERSSAAQAGLAKLEAAEPTAQRKPVVTSAGYSDRDEVYHERSDTSFFADLIDAAEGDSYAGERLDRHNKVQHERDASTASFPGLNPPNYLINEAVKMARAGRPFANACRSLPLPSKGMAININVVTGGTSAAAQTAQNAGVSETDMTGVNTQIAVNTVAGAQEVSRQAIDRGVGVDRLIMEDLAEELETKLDGLLLNGTGASGQPSGILKSAEIASGNVFTTDDDSPSAAETFQALIKVATQVVETRFRAPDFFLLHPRRLAYILGGLDGDDRPLWQSGIGTARNVIAEGAIGYGNTGIDIAGIPVISDANLPKNLGVGTNEDPAIAVYRNDCILWESPIMTISTDTNLAKNLGHTIVMHKYIAFKLRHDKAAAYSIGSLFEATL